MSLQHHVSHDNCLFWGFKEDRCLSSQACTTLMTCLIFARLDYCNAVFAGLSRREINRIQSVQNAAVGFIAGARKYDHVTPLLLEIHWLPIEQRVLFKLGVTMFKIVYNMAPTYLFQYAKPSLSSSSLRLRSADDSQLFVPELGRRTAIALLSRVVLGCGTVCQPPSDSSTTLGTFKKHIIAHLFRRAFPFS